MDSNSSSIEALQDIRKIMERSTRFISLSGLSGISAGLIALVGSYFAYNWIAEFRNQAPIDDYGEVSGFRHLVLNLLGLALLVLALVFIAAFYFTWRKARHDNVSVFDKASRRMVINFMIPVVAGGMFILGMLYHGVGQFVAPACLIFYGLGCVNGSKYTFTDIRFLGYMEIAVGTISMFFLGYGLYFWAFGFGVLHIIYGIIVWWKYEKGK